MSANYSFRVFRRNGRNCILLWNSNALPDGNKDSISAFLVDENGKEGPLSFSRFIPETPEKFSADVDGIVIPHAQNKMDSSLPYTVKVVIGEGEDSMEFVKDVLPVNLNPQAIPERPQPQNITVLHCYGMDYKTRKWVPIPVDADLVGEIA